jgi:hypothetical protein
MVEISSQVGDHDFGSGGPREVRVDPGHRGGWDVLLPDGQTCTVCDALDEARREARLVAGRRHPCEIVIRDAYHRVIDHQTVA